jgi:hypothetical protein
MRIEEICQKIWFELWRGTGLDLNKISYNGLESFPYIQHNEFVLNARWKHRWRRVIDGNIWFNGDRIFSYDLQLKEVVKNRVKNNISEQLTIYPAKSNTLVYIQLAFSPADFNTISFYERYIEHSKELVVPRNIWGLNPELFE